MLPDFLIPHKHYAEETITGVLNGVVGPDDEDSETCLLYTSHPEDSVICLPHGEG